MEGRLRGARRRLVAHRRLEAAAPSDHSGSHQLGDSPIHLSFQKTTCKFDRRQLMLSMSNPQHPWLESYGDPLFDNGLSAIFL